MSRLSRFSRPGWLTLGIVIGAIAIPAVAAAAAATVVVIRGPSNHSADVTPAGQLRATEMDPSFLAQLQGGVVSNQCKDLGAVSTTRGFVVKTITISATNVPNGFGAVSVWPTTNCSGSEVTTAAFPNATTHTIDLGNGLAVKPGAHLSMSALDVNAYAHVYGYTVPAAATP